MTDTVEHKTWVNMRYRCINKTSPNYRNYGGRGIIVESEGDTFEQFYKDMGDRPEGMSIERVDVNGNYCKDNCKWATHEEQVVNMRTNKKITYEDETLTLSQWSRRTGLGERTIAYRIKIGWTIEDVITKPLRTN